MDGMMTAMQVRIDSLDRQVKELAEERDRVRKLLTEFDERHDRDAARIAALEAEKVEAHRAGYSQGKAAGDAFGASLKEHIAALEAELAAARDAALVEVKPLEWHERVPTPPAASGFWCEARTIVGLYEIHSFAGSNSLFHLKTPDFGRMAQFDTLASAKAAAQTDYEARIRSALRTTPAPDRSGYPCDRCGHHFDRDAIVDHDTWAKISPTGDEGGLLCANCMVAALDWPAVRMVNAHAPDPVGEAKDV
ncbi:MAG: hypothetical protein JXQ91_07495 [Vannielia sp.]|uniref:hypothetical protein n=1 Tax=Vannielia sp. TaxID=2813045 RepID=UPI003B8C07B3